MTGAPVVELERVTVRYGDAPALRDVTLTVMAGERVAVLGPSGSGKSTLVGVLNGSVAASAGSVRLHGTDPGTLRGAALRRLRARTGTVHQGLDLVGTLRVVHEVNAGRLATWSLRTAAWSLVRPQGVDEARAALERVGLADRLYDRSGELSGGQQQRVALARLLVQDPELLLADEPASSLDPALAEQVLALLTDLTRERGRTLLACLHDPALAARTCDRVVGLRDGRVVLDTGSDGLSRGDLDALYAR